MENEVPKPEILASATAVPGITSPSHFEPHSAEKRLRIFELVLVILIAFGGSILYSAVICFGGSVESSGAGALRWANMGLLQAASLGLLWYVLRRRSASFKDLGFCWTKKDLAWSFAVWIFAATAFSVVYTAISAAGFVSGTLSQQNARIANHLFGQGISWPVFALLFLNPVFEELIARAYVMTEVKYLTNSISASVVFSTILQTSYHLYQGVPMAISDSALFLVFSLFYMKTNRITPVILAHFYLDLLSLLRVWLAQR